MFKDPVAVKRHSDALRRLRIPLNDLAAAPQITPLLKEAAGGLKAVMAAMRLSQDEVIAAFLTKYDAIPVGDRHYLPIEAIALAAGVDINHLLGSAMMAMQFLAVHKTKVMAMTFHPRITKARIKYALMASGEKDRTALDMAVGFLPSPKGPTFIGKAIFGSGKNVMDQQGGGDDDDDMLASETDPDLDKLFPPANAMQEKLTPIRQRLLSPGS